MNELWVRDTHEVLSHHQGGCNVPYGGREHVVKEKYEIL